MYDVGVLVQELGSTRCGQGQFICSVTGLHLPHLDPPLESPLWEPKTHRGPVLEHREWEAMVQTWEHSLAIPLELANVGPIWGNMGISVDPLDGFHIELLSYSPFHPICYMVTVKKKVGDRKAL